jgi:hypothetical protein
MFVDTFHDTYAQAMEELERRRANPQGKDLITRIDTSPYGGFRVRSMPADLWIELATEGMVSPVLNRKIPLEREVA